MPRPASRVAGGAGSPLYLDFAGIGFEAIFVLRNGSCAPGAIRDAKTYISAEQPQTGQDTWVPRADEVQGRPGRSRASQGEGSLEADGQRRTGRPIRKFRLSRSQPSWGIRFRKASGSLSPPTLGAFITTDSGSRAPTLRRSVFAARTGRGKQSALRCRALWAIA
jgi:hypothetical protein